MHSNPVWFSGFDAAIALPGDVEGESRVLEPIADSVGNDRSVVILCRTQSAVGSTSGRGALFHRFLEVINYRIRHSLKMRKCADFTNAPI
jgi:hypothetical protein